MKQRYAFRILSMLLALVLVFELFPTGALALETGTNEAETPTAQEVAAGEPSGTVLGEVTEYRDEREKHFRMEDGSFIAVDYGVPVHYALDEETWADIDNTLILQSASASAASTSAAQPMQIPQQYTAVNGDDAKAFAGNLATGFLFSAQRGQSGVQMSLLDGWTEPDELGEAETVPEETGTEEATKPATEPETPTETLPVTEPEETMPETEPVTESTEGMTESTEETLEAAQAEGATQLPVDAADNTEASFTLPEAAVQEDSISELEEETQPVEPQNPESIVETSPETEPETLPETEPETEPETTPETMPLEASEPVQEGAVEPYNRSATAQISYPDRQEEPPTGVAALFAAVQNLFQDEEDASFAQQITPSRLRTQVLYENVFLAWTCNMSCIATM